MQLGAFETNLKKILNEVKDLDDKQLIITIELEESGELFSNKFNTK
jgi:hypothetical protein